MLEGYCVLVGDVLKWVKCKVKEKDVELEFQEIIERLLIDKFLFEFVEEGVIKIVVVGFQLFIVKMGELFYIVEYIEEDQLDLMQLFFFVFRFINGWIYIIFKFECSLNFCLKGKDVNFVG